MMPVRSGTPKSLVNKSSYLSSDPFWDLRESPQIPYHDNGLQHSTLTRSLFISGRHVRVRCPALVAGAWNQCCGWLQGGPVPRAGTLWLTTSED